MVLNGVEVVGGNEGLQAVSVDFGQGFAAQQRAEIEDDGERRRAVVARTDDIRRYRGSPFHYAGGAVSVVSAYGGGRRQGLRGHQRDSPVRRAGVRGAAARREAGQRGMTGRVM